jgi:hypothetical protein
MNSASKYMKLLSVLGVIVAGLVADGYVDGFLLGDAFVSQAEARVGRPRTPASVAGAARRTTRRVVRRSAIYVSTLPASCAKVSVNGAAVWLCGGTYYQPYSGRYVVVYVD